MSVHHAFDLGRSNAAVATSGSEQERDGVQ